MNKQFLLQVADAIEANPDHFDMGSYFEGPMEFDKVGGKATVVARCGTTACVAGFAYLLHKGHGSDDLDVNKIADTAETILDLNEDQAHYLFHTCVDKCNRDEGISYGSEYQLFETPQEYASAAAQKIRDFVAEAE